MLQKQDIIINTKETNTKLLKKIIKLYSFVYHVESESVEGKFYVVIVDRKNHDKPVSCNCPHFEYNDGKIVCKHMRRVSESIEYERESGTVKPWWEDEDIGGGGGILSYDDDKYGY